jgi:hypothetical protein
MSYMITVTLPVTSLSLRNLNHASTLSYVSASRDAGEVSSRSSCDRLYVTHGGASQDVYWVTHGDDPN